MNPSIYGYIKEQESDFETQKVQVADNWDWNFREHVQMLFHLVNDKFYTGANDYMRAFKQVIEPMVELSSWTEDIEVKDVTFFIEQEDKRHISFLMKKYHDEVYTREHDLDYLFDRITEDDLVYGGVLVQKGTDVPEAVDLTSIAFCDQTDMMGGVIAFKKYFSPSKLRAMSKVGWGNEVNGATMSIEDLCALAEETKNTGKAGDKKNDVPTKNIEVYIAIGDMPDHYLNSNDNMEDYYRQVQIVAFYTDKKGKKQGVTLYAKKDYGTFKFFTSKEVSNRALGRGIGERLIHPQIWTNFLTIHKTGMLEAGSKVLLYTDDPTYTQKNKIQDMETLEITTIEEGKRIFQVPTIAPTNIQLYANEIDMWYSQAQSSGAAQDPLMGKESSSGTTFRGQERLVAQGKGSHDKRRGKRAKFIEEIYRDWILADIKKSVTDKKFLATLSTEELNWLAEELSESLAEKKVRELIFEKAVPVTEEERDFIKDSYKKTILKKGNQRMLQLLKEDLDGVEVKMGINIAGKQKNLVELSDKLLSIFQFIFANPQGFQQAMQIPAMSKAFESLLEFGGMSIGDFSSLTAPVTATPMPVAQAETPELALNAQPNE